MLQISLKTDTKLLSEVVVTGFGGSTIKRDLTGNIARVKARILNTCLHPAWMLHFKERQQVFLIANQETWPSRNCKGSW